MIEYNKMNLILAEVLGISEEKAKELELSERKNELFNLAFKWRENNTQIEQEEADKLNKLLFEIQYDLEAYSSYDMSIDYYINFNSFVLDNEYYNHFAW